MLKLVRKPKPKCLACQRMPDMWTPFAKLDDPSLTIGVRFGCDKCGYVGPTHWGPLQSLPALAVMAESAFAADYEGSAPECPWLMDGYVEAERRVAERCETERVRSSA